MEVYNVVGQYYLDFNINVLYTYYILLNAAEKQTENSKICIKSLKFKNKLWGDIKNSKTFKNALHIEFNKPKASTKVFPGGLIHFSGIKNLEILKELVEYIKSLLLKDYYWNSVVSDLNIEKFYSESLNLYCYCIDNSTPVLFNSDYVYSDTSIVVDCHKENEYIKTNNNYRNIKLLTHTGFKDIKLVMENRKNLPTKGKYFIHDNSLYYSYNNKKFGEFIYPEEETFLKKSIVAERYNVINPIKPNNSTEKFIVHNINKGFTIDKVILLRDLRRHLETLGIEFSILKQKTEIINFIFWYCPLSDSIFTIQNTKNTFLPIKIQMYNDTGNYIKVRFSTKIESLNPEKFIREILDSIVEKETTEDLKECTLLELYDLI